MTTVRNLRVGLAVVLTLTLLCGGGVLARSVSTGGRTHVVAYFDNSNGIFPGDEVRILGVAVGKVDRIEPQPFRAKITFWFDDSVKVPADAEAVILAPALVTDRAVQLTPAYTGGPLMQNDSVIPQARTAVPVEFDDLRAQLEKLTDTLQPTKPGGVSTLGALVDTAADNLRGQGESIHDAIIKFSQAISALGDHSADTYYTVKNLSILVSALHSSADLMRQLNRNLASVTAVLANDPDEVGRAIADVNSAVGDARSFAANNREALGTTSDKLASISTTVVNSLDDIKQELHTLPHVLQNYMNVYDPVRGSITGILALNQFANTISFVCGAIQAASRLGNEQSAKLCVQYLAPIIKNRQYNFLPLGENLFIGAQARPNEVTYSEDWMRPDYVPPRSADAPAQAGAPPPGGPPRAAEAPVATDPAAGLPGIMVPHGGGQ